LYLGGIAMNDEGGDATMNEEAGIYWNTARRVIKGLHYLDANARMGDKPITIIMNSCGGDWDHGMAIYDAIRQCHNHVTIINMSHARSMTSLIFQAADYRITAPHGFYMIHDGTEAVSDIPKTVYNAVNYTRTVVTPTMYNIYLKRLQELDEQGEPKVDIKVAAEILNDKLPEGVQRIQPYKGVKGIKLGHVAQLCGQDTYFTPEEMVRLNFADRMLETGDLAGGYANPKMHGLPTGQQSLSVDDAW